MKTEYQSYMLEQLKALMAIDSPSGFTKQVQAYLNRTLTDLGFSPVNPVKGGVLAHLGGTGDPLTLMAHVDTLGAVVHHIKDDGRLCIVNVGGLQPFNIETEWVKVQTRFSGVYEGTVQAVNASSHVNHELNTKRDFLDNVEVVLDEPVKSAEDVAALGISAGDFVLVNPRTTITKTGYIKSRFLDDKASAAVLLTLAKMVADEKLTLPRSVWIDFTVHEEIGYGGASGLPEGCTEIMSVDMGCVGQDLTCDERMVSICAKDSGGPYHYDTVTRLVELAREKKLDYAVDVYNYYSSDVEVSLKAGYDVRHSLIGPGVYASHGYERTHIDGLRNTFELLCAYLLG